MHDGLLVRRLVTARKTCYDFAESSYANIENKGKTTKLEIRLRCFAVLKWARSPILPAGRPKPGQSLFSPRWLTARHRSEAVFNSRRTRVRRRL